jgi:hypothetical protein
MFKVNEEISSIDMLEQEGQFYSVNAPDCPRLFDNVNLTRLYNQLINEPPQQILTNQEYSIIFAIGNDATSDIVRSIQEEQILKTKLAIKKGNSFTILPSFWDVWNLNKKFRTKIISSIDPNEAKWKLCREFGYKLATTFMPCYAMAIYNYFGCPQIVLDPCSGWGDRLLGAHASRIEKYIGFDPNLALRPGYSDIMKVCDVYPQEVSDNIIKFNNSYEIHSIPFENNTLEDNSVDFIFTSPPFFNYEIYTDTNPKYRDWIEEFYEPFFINCSRIVKENCYVCIYLSDTSAGNIERFITYQVPLLTNLVLQKPIGFKGIWSNEIRKIYVFKKLLK